MSLRNIAVDWWNDLPSESSKPGKSSVSRLIAKHGAWIDINSFEEFMKKDEIDPEIIVQLYKMEFKIKE